MLKVRTAFIAIALLAGLPVAYAQTTQQDHDGHHPETGAAAAPATPAPAAPKPASPGMGGMGMGSMMGGDMQKMMPMMMQMMRGMMSAGMPNMGPPMGMGPRGGMAALKHIEGQIAFYKAELHITDGQAAQWNTFADTLRAGARQLQDTYKGMMQGDASPSVADQFTRRRQVLSAELEALQSIEPAARALYGVLSTEQKKLADELMADHLRRM